MQVLLYNNIVVMDKCFFKNKTFDKCRKFPLDIEIYNYWEVDILSTYRLIGIEELYAYSLDELSKKLDGIKEKYEQKNGGQEVLVDTEPPADTIQFNKCCSIRFKANVYIEE